MPKVKKVKYVTKEVPAEDCVLPREHQQIVKPTKKGSPVTAEIHRILFVLKVKNILDQGMWPQAFAIEDCKDVCAKDRDSDDEGLFIYINRPTVEDFDDRSPELHLI
ncbi:hypothetical protein HPB50_000758 [Hyalomma asiaticum]|uniref:Uncharacterized protein n=1 Tax=Hyalomma asiaticum TaxID=266040 RepID=A0ACB7SU63_HYAAI|nr:hypothetical protein HPB50_000758 [Hyalomma asiaticum]